MPLECLMQTATQPSKLHLRHPAVLVTIGPARDHWGPDLLAYILAFWLGKALISLCRLKFETSNDGYMHFHLALMAVMNGRGPPMTKFDRALHKYMDKLRPFKPAGYDKAKHFSIAFYKVPITETLNTRILRGADLVNHYLDNPTKVKSTEGGNYQLVLEGFNTAYYLTEERRLAKLAESEDPRQSSRVLAKCTQWERWARKYYLYAKTHDMPPLDNYYWLHGMPNLLEVEKGWHFVQKRKGQIQKNCRCKFCKLF